MNFHMATKSISHTAFYRYFEDVHELMQALLTRLESEVFKGASPCIFDDGDPVALIHESLAAEVHIRYRHGPFLRDVSDAAGTNAGLENEWNRFLERFDNAVSERIAADQELGLIESFVRRPIAIALKLDRRLFVFSGIRSKTAYAAGAGAACDRTRLDFHVIRAAVGDERDLHRVSQGGAGCVRAEGIGIAAPQLTQRLITETRNGHGEGANDDGNDLQGNNGPGHLEPDDL